MMESNFESKPNQTQSPLNSNADLDSTQQTRFELLSAYLDGEVSPQERQQIQHWLDTDPATKQAYLRLLRLRQNLRDLPSPETATSPEDLPSQVFQRIQDQRRQKAAIWSGGAVALLCLSVLNLFPVKPNFVTQMAQLPQAEFEGEPLMVAINEPPVEIPQGAIAPHSPLGGIASPE
jgi:anti-sigma factor RsiW